MRLKEPVSALTHFAGVLFSLGALVAMLLRFWPQPAYLVGGLVFGMGLILLYSASTLYHWLDVSPQATLRLKKFDHMMIFVLIAATYTPICLGPMRGPWGWGILVAVWGIALLGMLFKVYWIGAPRLLSTMLYVLMGWIAVIGFRPMLQNLTVPALVWILVGGMLYTAGALVYAMRWPRLGFHEIFHLFVLGGSATHFWAIYNYI